MQLGTNKLILLSWRWLALVMIPAFGPGNLIIMGIHKLGN
jgi:hypothetical protein